jgi:hypothetical protein
VQNLSAHEKKKEERKIISTIAHTLKVVGCGKNGFYIGVAKEMKRM